MTLRKPLRACLPAFGLVCAAALSHAQTNFTTLVTDGAWTWFNDPRALFDNGTLYFGYNRAADGKAVLSALDLHRGIVTDLWSSSLTQVDDHDVPGLLLKQDGTMLAVYSRHQNDQFFTYRLSTGANPVAASDWGAEQTDSTGTTVSSGMTYANPFQLSTEGGRIYNFARYLNYNPNVFTSDDGGATWSAPTILIQTGTGSTRPYAKYCSDYTRRMDIFYTDAHPDNAPTSLYDLYYQNGGFYKTDGSFVKSFANLPILHDAGERGSVIYQYSTAAQSDPNQWIANARAWCWDIAYQTNGDPFCVFQVKVDNVTGTAWSDARIYYYYARWTGTNWQKRFIAQAGRPLYNGQPDYGGGICLDPLDPNTIYVSTDAANPFDLSTTSNVPLGANYQIWKGATGDGGLTFAWQPITGNSTVDNLRPYIPRRFGGEPCVLWFRGTYTSYTSFNCSIVGLFTSAVPSSLAAASGAWIADADGLWSDPGKWSNGAPAEGAGNTADFSTLNILADRNVTVDSSRVIGSLKFGDTLGAQNWLLNSTGGATLTLAGGAPFITVYQNTATLAVPLAGSSGFTKTGPGTLVLAAANSLSGTLHLDSGSTTANDGAVRVTCTAALANIASPILFLNNTGSGAVGSFQLDGSGGGIVVTQNFSTTCRNNNTIPTFENLAGTNILAGTNFCQAGGTNVIYQAEAGSLLWVTAPIQYVGTLTAARTFTFTGAGDVTVSGAILAATNAAPIGLVKTGSGALTLAGANTYTNGTTVSGGSLQVNGSLAGGRVNVTAGTLGGTGTIAGTVNIASTGTLAPGGAALGTLTISNTLTNTATTLMRLSKTGSTLTNDSLKVAGQFVFGGTLRLTNVGSGVLTAGDSFRLFSAASYRGAFSAISPATPGPGLAWNTNSLGTAGMLAVALGAFQPRIGQAFMNGGQLILQGLGGAAGYNYSVLSSTNLPLPLSDWETVGFGSFDGLGGFAFTNGIEPQTPQRFYGIRAP